LGSNAVIGVAAKLVYYLQRLQLAREVY